MALPFPDEVWTCRYFTTFVEKNQLARRTSPEFVSQFGPNRQVAAKPSGLRLGPLR
jgi:hypothetical protein